MKENKKDEYVAFTLAETMIVLSMLGVVAATCIPSIFLSHKKAEIKSKVQSSMLTFEEVVRAAAVEDKRIVSTSELSTYISGTDCKNVEKFLKYVQKDKCTFQTADGVWWQFSPTGTNYVYAVVGLKKEQVEKFETASNNNCPTIADNAPVFEFSAKFSDDGVLHLNSTESGGINTDHTNKFLDGTQKISPNLDCNSVVKK